jgi:hypothetical protein
MMFMSITLLGAEGFVMMSLHVVVVWRLRNGVA